MEETARVRATLNESISDIEPEPFHASLEETLADAALTPGVLTVLTVSAIDDDANLDAARKRGAGVQLSYEGLKLSRRLARDAPWRTASRAPEDTIEPDLDLIVAEVLVSRGFYFLARTGVASRAIDIVRRFGQNLTNEFRDETPEHPSLEVDVIKLAIEAGADLALPTVPSALFEYADDLAHELENVPLPEPEQALESVDDEIRDLVATTDAVTPESSRDS